MEPHHRTAPLPQYLLVTVILLLLPLTAAVNFESCLNEVRNGTWGLVGGTDNHGRPVLDPSTATAITYDLCIRACGASSEPFVWSEFAKQLSTWLFPWLALVSQLQFGAGDKFDELVSVLLTVGSPTLAAYSLALTVLNARWIARRFAPCNYPNIRNAVQILASLQHSPLTVTTTGSLLSSLVTLPENDKWWSELVLSLDCTRAWSISAVTFTVWAIIAYAFTIIDSFNSDQTLASSNGNPSIGLLWLWLLPIVISWFQVAPMCNSRQLRLAIDRTNEIAYVATPTGKPVLASSVSMGRAISLSFSSDDAIRCDEQCTAPIYNYARFFSWAGAVEDIRIVFHAASDRAHRLCSVDPKVDWEMAEKYLGLNPISRMVMESEVDAYGLPTGEANTRRSRWTHGIWSRFFVASALALSLQWSTTGAAIIASWFSPTVGFGCRSGAFLLYGTLATISWMILVLSSFLSYYSTTSPHERSSSRIAGHLSIVLRRLGKVVASFNAVWIILLSLFQFSNFYNSCYCNSSVLGLGARAFNVIIRNHDDILGMKDAWIASIFLGIGGATTCVLFVNLLTNPRLPG